MMRKDADVIVIGCGVIGASIAYNLSKAGKKVLILEANELCSGTSSATAARINMQDNVPSFFGDLAYHSYQHYLTLTEELGENIEFKVSGGMKVAFTQEALDAIEKSVKVQQALGYDLHMVSTEEALRIEPMLNPAITGGMYSRYDAQVNPFLLVQAYVKNAVRMGAELRQFTKVTDFIQDGRRILGVRTNAGDYYADLVICASGIQTLELGKQLGIPVFIHPERGCLLVSEKLPPTLRVLLNGATQRLSGNIIFGDTFEQTDSTDRTCHLGSIGAVAQNAKRLLPKLSKVKIIRAYTGIRVIPDDKFPILGPTGEYDNLWFALAHNAFRLNAEIGPLMARCICGLENIEQYSQFSYRRFLNS